MIFGHTLAECKKSVVAFAIFVLSAVALFVAYSPELKTAIIVLLGNGFAVVGVFMAPQFSVEDLQKTLRQLSGSVFSVLSFFFAVNPSLPVVIGSVIGLIPVGWAVWRTTNEKKLNALPIPVTGAGEKGVQVTAKQLASEAVSEKKLRGPE